MKEHRWVVAVIMPTRIVKNEDGTVYYTAPGQAYDGQWPNHIFCFDCDLSIEVAFGTPCDMPKLDILTDDKWEF